MDRSIGGAPRFPWLNAALFLATVATTLVAGFGLGAPAGAPITVGGVLAFGWPYAAALVGILGAHEMGHYVLARRHGVDATLPFFIPVPFGVGTFGAVMRMRSLPPSRQATLDIGVAGPLAGFAVALPLLFWGLAHSTIIDATSLPRGGIDSPLQLLLAWRAGRLEEAAGSIQLMGDSLVTWGAQRLVWGELPAGRDLLLHPVAFAAWLGMLVTALNLVPIGQLDGGHLTYALLGRERAARASRLAAWALLACGLVLSWNWLVWWLLARTLVGVHHPAAWDERPLDPARRAVAILGLALFALTFVPVPFSF
ncbi:MAG TPA: site-2 protease family protein [Anaeromyxobacteraceae bacterium]|nr:site-2 protease family protein [Anaeromyxobacteraceae bacterium]